MEFDTEAKFDAVVSERSLSEVRDDIEDELGDVEVQVAAQVDGGGGGAGGSRSVVDEFETEHKLSERRNELLEELIDAQEQGNYDRAARLGGGLGGAALAGMIGVGAMGLSALSEFEWPDMPQLEPPTIDPVEVLTPEPDWAPLGVAEPDWAPLEITKPDWVPLPVADPTGGGSGSDGGTGTSSPTPTPNPSVDDVQDPTGTSDPPPAPSPIPDGIQQPGPGPADAPAPAPGGDPEPTGDGNLLPGQNVGVEEVAGGVTAGAAAGGLAKYLQGAGKTAGGAAATFAAIPSYITSQAGQNSQERPEGQQTWFDKLVGDALGNTGLSGASASGAATAGTAATSLVTGGQGGGNDPGRERSQSATVEHSPTYNIQNLSELERQMQQDKRELQQEIEKVKNSLSRR